MREALRTHAPSAAGFLAMLLIAGAFAATIKADTTTAPALPVLPRQPIHLPGPGEDQDADTYADDVDRWDGDLAVRLEFTRLAGGQAPYLLVGTQDDQWRLGAGAELAWLHVVDHDALGLTPGSPDWRRDALRTGAWWTSIPMDGHAKAMTPPGGLDGPSPGATWPQVFHVNVRDDRAQVGVRVELWDADGSPDRALGGWDLVVDVIAGEAGLVGAPLPEGATITLQAGAVELDVQLRRESGLDAATKAALAARHAPVLRFAADERFYPTTGAALAQFHGFARPEPDYRTWQRSFNNGRDQYRLLLADFTGDRTVDHQDAALMTDILRAGGVAPDTVHAHVTRTTGDAIVIQYWFLSMYNFVLDETGRDIPALAHAGDREFIQLTFDGLDAANGTPRAITYSQHYKGIRLEGPSPGLPPYVDNATHPAVYVAQGSHASYPAPGDDRRLRPGYAGYGDVFDGQGERWTVDTYTLDVLGTQPWHAGHLWGPITRFHRDLGTSTRPLLQHDFRYPYIDPISWERSITSVPVEDVAALYGGEP